MSLWSLITEIISLFFPLEDLVFFFVDELLPDQMPETVHLMPQGTYAIFLTSDIVRFNFISCAVKVGL